MTLPGTAALRSFALVTVPAGSYFMMGDNRDNSFDSRYFGFVPRSQILGRAIGVIVSGNLDHYSLPRSDRFFADLK
jgi:signal peptidase I